jgi:ABC-type uncharacterized transport system auxiliary subunit
MITKVGQVCASLLAITAAAALAGCGSVRYPANYVLEVAPPPPAAAPPRRALGPLVVPELRCPAYLCEGRLVYREEPYRVGFYDYHRWAVSPRTALTRVLADRIRAASLFESVTVAGSPSSAAYLLRGGIERLEEVDETAAVHAICTISAELLDVKTGAVIWTGTFSESAPVQRRDVPGVVVGLAVSARTVADRLVASIAGELTARRSP